MKKKLSIITLLFLMGVSLSPIFSSNRMEKETIQINKEISYCVDAFEYSDEMILQQKVRLMYQVDEKGNVVCEFYAPTEQ